MKSKHKKLNNQTGYLINSKFRDINAQILLNTKWSLEMNNIWDISTQIRIWGRYGFIQ
jgi:hypothetical protein